MPMCPKCNRKRRVFEKKEKQKGKLYWIGRCVTCKTPLEMQEFRDERPYKVNP